MFVVAIDNLFAQVLNLVSIPIVKVIKILYKKQTNHRPKSRAFPAVRKAGSS